MEEIPDLARVQQDSSLQTEVIFVSVDDVDQVAHEDMGKLLHSLGVQQMSFHLAPDQAYRFIRGHYPKWNSTIPLNFLFTREGRLVTQTGITDYDEVRMMLDEDRHFYQ